MRIAVMVHERDRKFTPNYIASPMIEAWRLKGHDVEIVPGPHTPDSDVLFLHVDCTVLPWKYRRAVARHPCVINRHVRNISKSRISSLRVRTRWRDVGPVIVKTDMNGGGRPEYHKRRRLRRRMEAREQRLGPEYAGLMLRSKYCVFDSNRLVPSRMFRTRGLIVERFIPERFDELYGIRCYTFLGDRGDAFLYRSKDPIVKRREFVDWTPVEVPPELRRMQAELGFDYGKFDYVLHEGVPVLLDVNSTPASRYHERERRRQAAFLAPALEPLVERIRQR
ncbi:MAG: hypothetical protein V3T86_16190 [Planctomycetota bacterium]